MELPDEILLGKIQTKNVYLDRLSKEEFTNIIKSKYKLAGNCINEVYTFFVSTSKKYTCNSKVTIQVCQHDWCDKLNYLLKKKFTYFDLQRVEAFSSADLLYKMKDNKNGFPYAAKLSDNKYKELQKIQKNAFRDCRYLSTEKSVLIELALAEIINPSYISDRILDELGLL